MSFSVFNTVVILLLALLPALGWIIVYRSLDYRDGEPKRLVVMALMMGIFSTFPLFFLQYLFSNFPEYDLVSGLQGSLGNPFLFSVLFLLFVALAEELLKSLSFMSIAKRSDKAFNQVVDGIFYAALIGLGFALAENTYYFLRALQTFDYSGNFLAIFVIRSFGTMLAHTLFTGIFGFYFAKAYFSPFIKGEKPFGMPAGRHASSASGGPMAFLKAMRLKATFFYLFPQVMEEPKNIERSVIVVEGYLVAVILHFLYNAMIKLELFGQHWTFLMVPFIFILSWYLWSRFFVWIFNRIIDFIRLKRELYRVRIR